MRRAVFITALLGAAAARGADDAGVPSASIVVQVADGGETTIEVKHGELKVRAGGTETRVSAGQGVRVRRGEKANKVSLLPAPSRLEPPDGAKLRTLDVGLTWGEVPGAERYKLAIAQDAAFEKPLHESTGAAGLVRAPGSPAPAGQGRAKTSVHLPPGKYYWRVRAVDKDGLEGKPSAAQRFSIEVPPPKLEAGKPKWR